MTLALMLVLSSRGDAQIRPSDSPTQILNYVFAAQLGSGIYHVNGRTMQVYRLNITAPVYTPKSEAWKLRLGLPLTFGFYDFKVEDVIDGELPDRLSTLALVPTLELLFPFSQRWQAGPFLGLGCGKDFSSHIANYIFAVGLRSFTLLPRESFDVRIGVRTVYTGYTTKSMDFVDDFGIVECGVDFRRPLPWSPFGVDLDYGPFVAVYFYFLSPQLTTLHPVWHVRDEWEGGVTLGTHKPLRIFGIALPRLGISYRFGLGGTIRIIVGNPFPMLTPRGAGPEMQ